MYSRKLDEIYSTLLYVSGLQDHPQGEKLILTEIATVLGR